MSVHGRRIMRDSSQKEGDFACLGNTIDDTFVLTNPPEGGRSGGWGGGEGEKTIELKE